MEHIIKDLKEWDVKVSSNKVKLDKIMFDDLFKNVLFRLDKFGYQETFEWLKGNYEKGEGNFMTGVILLRSNSKLIKDKLWSLNQKYGTHN